MSEPKRPEESAAVKEAALKELCPTFVEYFNILVVVDMNGNHPVVKEYGCKGHPTFEEVILCHEANRAEMSKWANHQVAEAKRIIKAWGKELPPGFELGVGSYRAVIVKRTTEYMEEQPLD